MKVITAMTDDELLNEFLYRKALEAAANVERVLIEAEIIHRLGKPDMFKSKTHNLTGGWKVSIKQDGSFKMDWASWATVRGEIPDDKRPTRMIEAIDIPKMKALRTDDPVMYAKMATALTFTPSKTAITVERKLASTADERDAT